MAHSAPRLTPSIIFKIPLLFSYCPPGRFSPLSFPNRAVFRAARYAREAFEYLVLREQALAA
ncbi:hypothetical protein IV503_19555 [Klebsiella huaxiensis]|uniref:hypothetical protein n=1 Tax=Klebsiella huaxiensis TaxID=2153354 RepID=UPI002F2C7C4B